jgi:hypothetical protein
MKENSNSKNEILLPEPAMQIPQVESSRLSYFSWYIIPEPEKYSK